jgi:hypothetical protein
MDTFSVYLRCKHQIEECPSIRRLTVTFAVRPSGRTPLLCRLPSHSAGNSKQDYAKGMSRFLVSYLFLTLFSATERP